MKRLFNLFFLSLVLLAACNKEEIRPTTIKVQIESVSGSRARFTVVTESSRAYYSYIIVREDEPNFNAPATAICDEEIENMVKALPFFENGSFTDIFCFRGSRQLTMRLLEDDKDYKFIVFQINPKTYKLIGDPVVCNFHTKPVPDRDLHFEIEHEGDILTITPSDDNLTYIWGCEESEMISDIYGFVPYYLYRIVEMYQEYGFLDILYDQGPIILDLSMESNLHSGTEYTLAISGCEESELTTPVKVVKFRYQSGNIEFLEVTEESLDELISEPQSVSNLRYSQHQIPIPCTMREYPHGAQNGR